MIHGKRVGKNINQQLKEFTDDKFEPLFLKNVTEYLAQKEVLNRIVTVKKTYLKRIQTLLKNRLAEGQTIQQASREIKKLVNQPNFNKAEALRIARTETTAAANFAATQSGEVSGFVMEKEWISFIDGRTRDDHISADGQRVPQNEAFSVGGEKLMYPGAPNGSAGNVINCRCAVAVLAKRDNDGNLIPVS
jgi:SPP1 gp7 family putative phage head morphogenesis protein